MEPAGASPKNFNGLSLVRLQCSQDQIEVIHLSTHSFTHTRTQSVSHSVSQSVICSFVVPVSFVSFRFVLANCRNYFVSPNTNLNQQLSHGAIHEALSFALLQLQLPFRFQFLAQLFRERVPHRNYPCEIAPDEHQHRALQLQLQLQVRPQFSATDPATRTINQWQQREAY